MLRKDAHKFRLVVVSGARRIYMRWMGPSSISILFHDFFKKEGFETKMAK